MSNHAGIPADFLSASTTSFAQLLSQLQPESLPVVTSGGDLAPHGTTIVAVRSCDGVVMAGDRRATMGNLVAARAIRKVFAADDFSIVGIAGTAGLATELVKLFQVELEHYEKLEGTALSLNGKANRLAGLLRANLGLALQGLGVLPLFAGWDQRSQSGRIFSFDATGGCYEETDFYAIGSGSHFARGSLKKLYRDQLTQEQAATVAIQALIDAADDDTATAGLDQARGIYPTIMTATATGALALDDAALAALVEPIAAARAARPDGPNSPLL
ncbi:MAG: proteasome subunit beta [Propionibacteriaceae bacterium]